MRFLVKLLLPWMILGMIFASIAAGGNFLRFRQLAARGVAATGTVTALEPSNHRLVHYSYEASGGMLAGKGRGGFGNPEFEYLHVGDAVAVSYLPDDSAVSCLGNPRQLLNHTERFMLGPATIFPTFVLIVYYRRYPSFRRWLMR